MDEPRFDIWMCDPYRWDPEDGPYVGYSLHYANQTIKGVTTILLQTEYWDVAVVEAGSQPFVKSDDGNVEKSNRLYMIAHCMQAIKRPPGEPKSLAELLRKVTDK